MLRILIYRSFWSACLFAIGMVFFVAAILVPTEDRYLFGVLSVVGVMVSLLIQVTQPLILVLRRSVSSTIDVTLADIVLPMALHYGRPVWLENPHDKMVRGQLFRYSPYATYAQLMGLVVLGVWVFRSVGPLQAVIILLLAFVGSTFLLDASVGNSAARAAAFVIAASMLAPIPTQFPSLGQLSKSVGIFVLVFGVVYGICQAGHALRLSKMSPIGKSVRNLFDRLWLCAEMWLPLCFVTRYIHGGPAVFREVTSKEPYWRTTVLALLGRTTRAIMDVSELEPKSGLEWELKTCFEKGIDLLLMCHKPASPRVFAYLRSVLPDATILPDDFYNVDRLKRLDEELKVPLLIYFEYGDEGVASRVYSHMGVFFGETSIRDYFQAIRASTKKSQN